MTIIMTKIEKANEGELSQYSERNKNSSGDKVLDCGINYSSHYT